MAPITNPFATINGNLPPLQPKPEDQAPLPVVFSPAANEDISMGPLSKAGVPAPKSPVWAPVAPQQIEEKHLSDRLSQDSAKDAAKPQGVWAKIAHGLNVATGGVNRRGWEEQGLEKRLNDLMGEQSQNDLRGATTAHTEEETQEMPGAEKSKESLESAQAENQQAEAQARRQPDLARAYAAAVNSAMQGGRDPGTDPVVQHLADAITSIQRQPLPKGMEKVDIVGPDGKPMQANYSPTTGVTTDPSGKVIPNPQPYERPNQAGMVTLIAPDPNTPGGGIVERVGAGTHIAPGSQTTAGFSSMNTPTTTVRTAAARAQMVNDAIPGVLADIERNKQQMGPIMGRWSDFMQGKVGSDNPDFAALRMDLTLMGTAVALAHAQGRLPENLREEFDRAINAPQQTPENLEAAIRSVQPWMQRMVEAGGRPGAAQQPSGPKAGTVEDGYRFKGGDPKDQENWEKVK